MTIDPVTAGTAATGSGGIYTTAPTRTPKQAMDGEVFMSLLVTQLRNQDPSSPMDTNQMISQTTQLAMMEKMTDLSGTTDENFSLQMRTAAAALLGRQVTYTGKDGASVTDVASAVSYSGKVPQVTVGGTGVALDAITAVSDPG